MVLRDQVRRVWAIEDRDLYVSEFLMLVMKREEGKGRKV